VSLRGPSRLEQGRAGRVRLGADSSHRATDSSQDVHDSSLPAPDSSLLTFAVLTTVVWRRNSALEAAFPSVRRSGAARSSMHPRSSFSMRSDIRLAVTMSLAAAAIGVADPFAAIAAPITPGNLVIYRVGDGVSGTLSALGTAVFLDEYTTAGSLVQTIPVPTTGTTQQMVAVGNASTEGIISRSQDGAKLVFMGYRNTTGTTPGGSTVPRVIGTLDVAGTLDTSIAVTDMTSAVPRSATTVDGSRYWLATSTGVRYVPTPIASSTSVLIDSRNSRQVNLADNVLYATNGSTGTAAKVQSYGTLPTVSTVPTPLVTTQGNRILIGLFSRQNSFQDIVTPAFPHISQDISLNNRRP